MQICHCSLCSSSALLQQSNACNCSSTLSDYQKLGWTHDIVRMPSAPTTLDIAKGWMARLPDYSIGSHFLTNGLSDFWASEARPSTTVYRVAPHLSRRCARGENLIEGLEKLAARIALRPPSHALIQGAGKPTEDSAPGSVCGVVCRAARTWGAEALTIIPR